MPLIQNMKTGNDGTECRKKQSARWIGADVGPAVPTAFNAAEHTKQICSQTCPSLPKRFKWPTVGPVCFRLHFPLPKRSGCSDWLAVTCRHHPMYFPPQHCLFHSWLCGGRGYGLSLYSWHHNDTAVITVFTQLFDLFIIKKKRN